MKKENGKAKALWALLPAAAAGAAGILLHRRRHSPPRIHGEETVPLRFPDPDQKVLERLSKAISFSTVAGETYETTDFSIFEDFIQFLEESFPQFHRQARRSRINQYALLYHWKGKASQGKPLLFMAHYDVVPVSKETQEQWKYPGFSGEVAEGRVWGRGTLDIKGQLMALLETAEKLLEEGYTPPRDIYFAFGHDEETQGMNGASKVVEYLKEKGIQFDAVYDEGGLVVTGTVPGVKAPVALIGVGEKGYADVRLRFLGEGGHASMPPVHTALGKAGSAIAALEKNPMPPRLTKPVEIFLKNISSQMGSGAQIALANPGISKPLLLKKLSANPTTNAMIRTTTAATMAKGADASNVLPQTADIIINSRLLQGDTSQDLKKHLEKHCPPDTEITFLRLAEASTLSPTDTAGYRKLSDAAAHFYPHAIVTPYLVMGGTDSRKYSELSSNIYRFTPILVSDEEKNTMHNVNESISIENYSRMMAFYEYFIKSWEE